MGTRTSSKILIILVQTSFAFLFFLVNLQFSTVAGKPTRTCNTVSALDTMPPKFSFLSCGISLTLSVTNSTSNPYDTYNVDWGDGEITTDVLNADAGQIVHRYATRQPYFVRVDGCYQVAGCRGKTLRVFTPDEPPKLPLISRLDTLVNQIRITIDNEDGGLFAFEQQVGKGSYQVIADEQRAKSSQLTASIDTTQITCFRLVRIEPCFPLAISPVICYKPAQAPKATEDALAWWVPSAFTPNGDKENDTFGVTGEVDPKNFQLSILNRWNMIIFQTTDPFRGWNGTVENQPAPVGVYGFQIQNGRSDTKNSQKSGVVLLMR